MKITNNEIRNIGATLPIGYYAKRRITMEFSEDVPTSFYDPMTDSITISLPILQTAFEKVDENADRETTIRSMLYHEVSHAILTPDSLSNRGYWDDVMNIFEDERIETLLNTYYMNTDFKSQVYAINGIKDNSELTNPRDVKEAFYQLVRFHKGEQKWLDEVVNIIKKYATLHRATPLWGDYENNPIGSRDYYYDVQDLYNRFSAEQMANGVPKTSNSNNPNGNGKGNGSCGGMLGDIKPSEDGKDGNSPASGEESKASEGNGEKATAFDIGDLNNLGDKGQSLDDIIQIGFAPACDENMFKSFDMIISNFRKKNNSGSAFRSYSGVFNPRNIESKDYRFFDRQANINGANKFGTFHLNLFLDNSGSFSHNKDTVNAMIGALLRIEKQNRNFTFNVVHCSVGEKLITDKKKYGLTCNGGTSLDYDAIELYRKLQKPNTLNHNIILYDGSCYNRSYKDAFKAFNHSNCTIISDPDNETQINKYAPSAKRIITTEYKENLLENVLSSLDKAFR